MRDKINELINSKRYFYDRLHLSDEITIASNEKVLEFIDEIISEIKNIK